MNVYALREKSTLNYLKENRKWALSPFGIKFFTSLSRARQARKSLSNKMSIKYGKIEIIEYELVERASL